MIFIEDVTTFIRLVQTSCFPFSRRLFFCFLDLLLLILHFFESVKFFSLKFIWNWTELKINKIFYIIPSSEIM